MGNNHDNDMTQLSCHIPIALHRSIMGYCGISGIKMKDLVFAALESYMTKIESDNEIDTSIIVE